MKFLVTGGAGFIGSHLCDLLLEKGHKVIILDDLSNGSKENVPKEVNFIKGDIQDTNLIESISKDCDAIFHQAAIADIQLSLSQPKLVNTVNIDGTLNILEAARKNDIPRVIFASSSSIYGDATSPIPENTEPDPKSPYALTKLIGEHYLRIYSEIHGLNCTALRYFNVYGPRQKPGPVIPSFLSNAKQGKPLTIYGEGSQTRDFVYVKDVAQANLLSHTLSGFHTFNIGTGQPISIKKIAEKISQKTGAPIEQKPPRPAETQDSYADISKAKELLNWAPQITLEKGLRELT